MSYLGDDGRHCHIPPGPCLVERDAGPLVDIVWGAKGQNSAVLPIDVMVRAADSGHLVLLD